MSARLNWNIPKTAFPASVSLWSGDMFDVSWWPKGLTTFEGLVHSGKIYPFLFGKEKVIGTVIPAGLFLQPPTPKSSLHGNSGGKNPRSLGGTRIDHGKGSDEPTHHSLKHGWPHMDKIKTKRVSLTSISDQFRWKFRFNKTEKRHPENPALTNLENTGLKILGQRPCFGFQRFGCLTQVTLAQILFNVRLRRCKRST